MAKLTKWVLVLGLAQAGATPLVADDKVAASASAPPAASCMSIEALKTYAADENGFILNNFSVREAKDAQSAMTQLEVAYSIANRSDQPVRMSADFVFQNEGGEILAAMTANPDAWQVDPSVTAVGRGRSFVVLGTLAHVKKACLRIFGTLP